MATNWNLSEEKPVERYIRCKLIRFGYLSLAERRRLMEKYGDLDERFERGLDWEIERSSPFGRFSLTFGGLGVGGTVFEPGQSLWVSLILFAIAIVTYWALALWYLHASNKDEEQRNERFPEWRR